MNGSGIDPLVPFGSAQVGLEDAEPVVVLLLTRVGLSERSFEVGEVTLGVEEWIVRLRHDLSDQRIAAISYGGRNRRG